MKDEIKRFYTFFRNNEQTLKELKNEITGKVKSEKAVYMHIISKAKENGFNFTYEDMKNYEKDLSELSDE